MLGCRHLLCSSCDTHSANAARYRGRLAWRQSVWCKDRPVQHAAGPPQPPGAGSQPPGAGPGTPPPLPPGQTRVVELRVHGFSGTAPESLMDAVAAVDVDGDGLGRVVRPADRLRRPIAGPVLMAGGRPVPRVVEGYVW